MLFRSVENGGTLVTTYMSGIVGQSDNVYLGGYPGPLRRLTGVWVEEIDALAPEQSNEVVMLSGDAYSCGLVCDLMHLESAESLGSYGADFYKGMPAVTRNRYGKGQTYYIGAWMEERGLSSILDLAAAGAGVEAVVPGADGLEVVCRKAGDRDIYFVINFGEQERRVPTHFIGHADLLSGKVVSEDALMKKFDVAIILDKDAH